MLTKGLNSNDVTTKNGFPFAIKKMSHEIFVESDCMKSTVSTLSSALPWSLINDSVKVELKFV